MPISRIVDPARFMLLGAVTDWLTVYRRHVGRQPPPEQIARERGLPISRIVQLRWVVAPELGYPSAPFRVWRRPALPTRFEEPVTATQVSLFGNQVLHFDRPRVFVRATLEASAGSSVLAFAGAPFASMLVDLRALVAGFNTVPFSGVAIQCLVVVGSATVMSITGIDGAVAQESTWQPAEVVGLPGDAAWAGLQGQVGRLGDPRDAALDRFARGAPFYGWNEQIAPGVAAPPWVLARPEAMLQVMAESMLAPLHTMLTALAPRDHASFEVEHVLAAPPGGRDATARFRPLQHLVFGAATDPLASLISGFGTAFPDEDLPPVRFNDREFLNDPSRSDWDFMVTALYERGLDGHSEPVEYCAFVFAPAVGAPPPVPANMLAAADGLRSPASTDDDWRGVIRVSWDKVDDTLPFRAGSYAFARAGRVPVTPTVALMDTRPHDEALQPISATTSPGREAASGRLRALDERYALASAPPTNSLLYGLAHQDLFGLWSAWSSAPLGLAEPPVRDVTLLSVRLDPQAAAGATCPATLTVDFAWDWATRSPAQLAFVARLYGQARLGDPPADLTLPAGLQTSLAGGPGSVLALDFNGADAPAISTGTPAVTATLEYLSEDGRTLLGAPVGTAGPRRYRMTITGFALDFNAAPRIGLALWARGTEWRAPRREGNWSARPLVASTADPRPPLLLVEREEVQLASMPDAAGLHHAHLEWPAAAGAVGYFVYTGTEEKLRADHGMASAARSQTLSQRLAALRAAFAADPMRRSFTRVNAQPVAGTRMAVTLPRGSKEIHLYVVLGVSAGEVESPWPLASDPGVRKRPIAYAAPQVALPAPPELEVATMSDMPPAYSARVRIRAGSGAKAVRIDLHRVRVPDAAAQLDTMGPPLARITGSAGEYHVTPSISTEPGLDQPLARIDGNDRVPGSWKRVYYRAVAWSGDDPARGIYGGRSVPSALREVVVPPPGPPDLAPLTWHWPGSALADVRIGAATTAPVEETPLGPHRVRAEVMVRGAADTLAPLYAYPASLSDPDRLDRVPVSPPAPGAQGLWHEAGALHLLVRRASTDDRLAVRLIMIDPLGRATERLLGIPRGSPLPAPDIQRPTVRLATGRGFLFTFETRNPLRPTPLGPYMLSVRYTPRSTLPFPPPGPGPRPPITVKSPLGDIQAAVPGENPFTDPAPIPLRRTSGAGDVTRVVVALRGTAGGTVTIVLRSPDTREATLTRELP